MISHRSLLYFFVEHGRKSVAQNHQTQICCSFCNFSFKFSFSSGAISSIFACDPLHTQSKTTSQMCPKLSKCVRTHPLTVPGQPWSSFSFISLSKLGMERCKGNSKASPASKWISSCISKKRDRRERNCFFFTSSDPHRGMCPDMLSGIPSDILYRKHSAILPEVCPDALRDMYYDVLCTFWYSFWHSI